MSTVQTLATMEAIAAPAPAAIDAVSRVYCGRCVPDGSAVTDADVASFVDEVVSAHFPDGFTVLNGQGGWRDHASGQTIREDSVVFEFMHGSAAGAAVYAVARAYKARFRQDAVGVTTTPVAVQFV